MKYEHQVLLLLQQNELDQLHQQEIQLNQHLEYNLSINDHLQEKKIDK